MYCTSCGTENPAGAHFCGSCGHEMAAAYPPGDEHAATEELATVEEHVSVEEHAMATEHVAAWHPAEPLPATQYARRRLVRPATVAVTLVFLLLVGGLAAVFVQATSRSADLKATRIELRNVKDDLDLTSAKLKNVEGQLTAESRKLATANTELAGVRGSLKATSSERDAMRKCFDGFLEAIASDTRSEAQAILKRVEKDCDKIDHLF